MSQPDNLGGFIKENKNLLKEYWETRLEIYRLQGIKAFSKTAGYFIWIIISLFLAWLLIIFVGLVLGFWLSDLTGSYVKGFGITALIILLKIVLLAVFRKPLFINPIIRGLLKKTQEDTSSAPPTDSNL